MFIPLIGLLSCVEKTNNPLNIDNDGDGFYATDDCNDSDATINPSAEERCDGIDNNCNGDLDEGVQEGFYVDADGDGFGSADITIQACSPPSGFTDNDADCNDFDPNSYPGNTEVCDGNDNDCDGSIDSGLGSIFYIDAD